MAELGADVRIADVGDKAALREAFSGSQKAYLLNPPALHYDDFIARTAQVNAAMVEAANEAGIRHVVALSSISAYLNRGTGCVLALYGLEQELKGFRGKSTIVRAPFFMENWVQQLAVVLKDSIVPSMHVPLNYSIPMAAAEDIADVVTDCLVREPSETSIVELYGPKDYTPQDVAGAFSSILHKPITAFAVLREGWEPMFASLFNPRSAAILCELYDGANTGLTVFEGTHETRRGKVTLEEALLKSVEAYSKAQTVSEGK